MASLSLSALESYLLSSFIFIQTREVCESFGNTTMTPLHLGLALCDEAASDRYVPDVCVLGRGSSIY